MKSKLVLEYDDSAAIIAACHEEAQRLGLSFSLALVDDGGYALRIERMDGVGVTTPMVAYAKARTSALMRGPSGNLAARVREEPELLRLEDYLPMRGGLPIMANGQCIGGIGISGGRPEQDEQVAAAGVAAAEKRLASST